MVDILEISRKETRGFVLTGQPKLKRVISLCGSAADMHLYFLHVQKAGFLMTWLIYLSKILRIIMVNCMLRYVYYCSFLLDAEIKGDCLRKLMVNEFKQMNTLTNK